MISDRTVYHILFLVKIITGQPYHTYSEMFSKLSVSFSAEPILEDNTHVNDIEYSPLVCGFGITLNDGRAAYLTAPNLKFDPNVSKRPISCIHNYVGP